MKFRFEKKIDNLGRIVIPKSIRDFCGIELNDELILIPCENGVLITKKEESKDK